MKLLIIFIYLITINFSYASEKPDLKNLVLLKNPKLYKCNFHGYKSKKR